MREKDNPLLKQIQLKKEEMFICARETGFNSRETIVCSQELDKLIFEYQREQQEMAHNKIQLRQFFWFLDHPKTATSGFDT